MTGGPLILLLCNPNMKFSTNGNPPPRLATDIATAWPPGQGKWSDRIPAVPALTRHAYRMRGSHCVKSRWVRARLFSMLIWRLLFDVPEGALTWNEGGSLEW